MENSQAEKDPKLLEFEFLSRPTLEISRACEAEASDPEFKQQGEEEETCQAEDDSEEHGQAVTTESKEHGIVIEEEEIYDGYQTPTSSEQRIPAIPQCPPAPKKPRSMPLKRRKARCCGRSILIDVHEEELESLFRPFMAVGSTSSRSKRARTGDIK
ncbi:hypothetical protein ACLOJK_029951 [Asimina triloba]